MQKFILAAWGVAVAVLLLANIIWGGFPVGAMMAVAVIFFRWSEAIFWILTLGLVWEISMPIPMGAAAIPMCVAGMLMQLLGRHQLRSNNLTRAFCAMILQSVGHLAVGLVWPPRNVGALSLQMTEAVVMLVIAGLLAPAITTAVVLSGQRIGVSLEGRLREL